ncbi:MAG: EAL domain-containing protein [Phycisphaerales bacterium]|nr:EAL domain-containing protein [Phycisphaerales bacterium]
MLSLRFIQSIKMKLILMFMIAGAIPMVISMVVINQRSREVLITKSRESIIENAATRESMLNDLIETLKIDADYLASVQSTIEFMGSSFSGDPIPDDVFESAALNIAAFQKMHWGRSHHIMLVDHRGIVVLNAPDSGWEADVSPSVDEMRESQGPHLGQDISGASYFEDSFENTVVTGFFGFEERDHYHQLVLAPITDKDDNKLGLLVIEVSIDFIMEMMHDGVAFGETGNLYLATKEGIRVVHKKSDYDPSVLDRTGVLDAVDTNEPVVGWYEPEPGHHVLGVYHASRIYPWTVCVEVDRDEVFAPIYAQQRLILLVTAGSLTIFAVMVLVVGRVFWKPLRSIAASACRVADGDLWHEIPQTRQDEIGKIELAVDSMRVAMKQQIDHLDSQVAMRTAELEYVNEKLKHDAEHDMLTGLANRSVLERMLEEQIELYKSDSSHLISVLFFDFDRFKIVNDSLGHATGDALLCSIADRFRSELRDTDLPARFGGDEFVIVLSPVESEGHAHQAADRLLKLFEEAHVIDGHRITSTASIGLVIADSRYDTADEMIRDADAAMYEAKLAGKGQVIAFDEQMFKDAKGRLCLEEDLRNAIVNDELRVVYQPIIGMETMETVGFEALIRWKHPELGMVRPDQFISIAEDTGQIVDIGAWILREAVEQTVRWDEEFGLDGTLSINVNVAKRQLIHPEFLGMVRDVLKSTGLAPYRLKIEITESTVIDPRHDMSEVVRRVRQLGVLIAMDDFGTGHSSLSMLHQFEFDILKIDQSFVQGMEDSRELGAVLHSIIALAQNTGMKVVAEGAETKTQVACLISHECDMIQGYYFSRPLPPKEAGEFLSGPHDYSQAA